MYFLTVCHVLPNHLKWRTLCSHQPNLLNTFVPVPGLLPDHCLSPLIIGINPPLIRQHHSVIFSPNIQNQDILSFPINSFHQYLFYLLWALCVSSVDSTLSLMTFLLSSHTDLLFSFTVNLGSHRLYFYFLLASQQHGQSLILIFTQNVFSLFLKSSTLKFPPLATIF